MSAGAGFHELSSPLGRSPCVPFAEERGGPTNPDRLQRHMNRLTATCREDMEQVHKEHRQAPRRGWKRIHHSPVFWIGFFLFLAAIAIYVLSGDLSWRPRLR